MQIEKLLEEQKNTANIIYSQVMRSSKESDRPVSADEAKQLLIDWHKQSLKQFIDGLVEGLEGAKKEITLIVMGFDGVTKKGTITEEGYKTLCDEMENRGYNEAVDKQIHHLKEIRKQLE